MSKLFNYSNLRLYHFNLFFNMRSKFTITFQFLLILFVLVCSQLIQAQVTVSNYNACPGQSIIVTANWNNAANVTYILNSGTPPNVVQANPNFTIFSNTSTQYTITGNGVVNGLPAVSSATFNLSISAPPPLTFTNPGQFCFNSTATFTAPIGGISYSVSGPPGTANFVSNSNIISINNVLPQPNTGQYTITTLFSGCTNTGVTNISVAPNTAITISSPTNICLGTNYCLSSNLPTTNNGYNWTGPNGFLDPSQNPCISFNSVNQGGVYTVYSNIVFGNITCPRSASTSVNVVQTVPVSVAASPAYTLCQGANLNLSAGASGAIGFSWLGPQSYLSSIQNPFLTNITPIMAGTYSVTALFTNGVITCTTGAAVTVSIVSTAQPIIYATSNVCKDGVVNFSATTSPAASTYSWTGPQQWTSFGAFPVITGIQANQSGIYYVYAKFSIGSTQCTTSKSVQINVVPVNTITVIPPGSVCEPNNAYLQASAVGAYQFSWAGPNGFSSSLPNPPVYYPTTSASGIYTVTATFYNGIVYCYSTNTVALTINPLLNFTLVPRQQACYNSPISISGPNGATSYTWTSSTGFTSNSQNIYFSSIQPNNSGTYTLNVSLGPCITGKSTEIDVLTPIQFTLTPFNRTVCKNDTTILFGGVSGGSENYAYTWNPSVYLIGPNGNNQKCSPLGTTIYNFIAYDIACPNYTIAHTFSVIVNQPPLPDLKLDKTTSCQPLCLFLNSRTQSQAAITTYDFGGTDKIQKDSFNYCIDKPGTFNLKILSKGKNGCSGIYEYPQPIVVYPKPGTKINWNPESPTITEEVTFNPTFSYEPTSYTWFFSGLASGTSSDTLNIKNPQLLYNNTGQYPVILICKTENECTDTVIKYINIRDDYNIFIPNSFTPNNDGINDVFQIKGSGLSEEGFLINIYDRWGKIIYTSKDINSSWDGKVNDNKVGDGIYIYKVKIVGSHGEGRKEFNGQITLTK